MTNNNRDVLKATILKKLKRRGKWGGAHTSFDRLITGIPKHLKGETKNAAKDPPENDTYQASSCSLPRNINPLITDPSRISRQSHGYLHQS